MVTGSRGNPCRLIVNWPLSPGSLAASSDATTETTAVCAYAAEPVNSMNVSAMARVVWHIWAQTPAPGEEASGCCTVFILQYHAHWPCLPPRLFLLRVLKSVSTKASVSNVVSLYTSGEITRILDQVVGSVDLTRPFLGDLTHAFRQPAGSKLVRMVLAHQASIGPLHLRDGRVPAYPERCVRIVEFLLRRRCPGRPRRSRPEERLQLRHIAFRQAEPSCHADQHLVLGRMHVPVGRHRHHLDLEENVEQWAPPPGDPGKFIHCRIEIEVRCFAPVEGGLRHLTLRGPEVQPVHDRFC